MKSMNKTVLLASILSASTLSGVAFAAPPTNTDTMGNQTSTPSTSSDTSSSSSMASDAKMDANKTGNYISDSALTTKVKSELLTKKGLSSSDINVVTTNGVVALNGTVPSKSQVKVAYHVTKSIKGVKSVTNNLEVKPDQS